MNWFFGIFSPSHSARWYKLYRDCERHWSEDSSTGWLQRIKDYQRSRKILRDVQDLAYDTAQKLEQIEKSVSYQSILHARIDAWRAKDEYIERLRESDKNHIRSLEAKIEQIHKSQNETIKAQAAEIIELSKLLAETQILLARRAQSQEGT